MEKLIRRRFGDEKIAFTGEPHDFILLCDWLFLAAAFAGVDLGFAVRNKYPGLCPYCMQKRCQCETVKFNTHKRWDGPVPEEGTIYDLQQMLTGIYPRERHTLKYCVEKVLEEIEEARQELEKSSPLIQIREELADVFARLSPLAQFLGMPLC